MPEARPPRPPKRPPGRLRRLLRGALRTSQLLLLLAVVAVVAAGVWFDRAILNGLPHDLADVADWRPPTACRLTDSEGARIDEFYTERRFWVPLDELPDHLLRSIIVAEDRSFGEHDGIDPRGVGRALRANWDAGAAVQGGSTITQQMIKRILVGDDRTLVRKLKEAVLARRLERAIAKTEILELYVNTIALGAGNYGVEAASLDYFGMSARHIDPGQSALLAGLIPAPSRWSPRADPGAASRRRGVVLRKRVELGDFPDERAIVGWLNDPVLLPRQARAEGQEVATAYRTEVRRRVRAFFGDELPFEAGLLITTPLDLELQVAAQLAVDRATEALVDRQGPRGPRRRLVEGEHAAFLAQAPLLVRDPASGAVLEPEPGHCFEAMVGSHRRLSELEAGPFVVSLAARDRWRAVSLPDDVARRVALSQVVRPGDVLMVCAGQDGGVVLDRTPWAEGAAVVVENNTGRVVALVGGRDVGLGGFVRATQARRQPGSTFKTFVYATALQRGGTQVDLVWSVGPNGEGPLRYRRALASSINDAAVEVYRRQPRGSVQATARAMGVRTPLRDDLSVALGSSEVTPLDLAMAYSTVARLGVPTDPVFIDAVHDVRGAPVARAGEPVELAGKELGHLPGAPQARALDRGVAWELLDVLQEVFASGTARRFTRPGYARAGKTGTTDEYVDAWFVGSTPRWTVAVWIGTDGRFSLGPGEYGSRAALPAWDEIVRFLEDRDPGAKDLRFEAPPEAVLVPVGAEWMWLRRGNVPAWVMQVPSTSGSRPVPGFLAEEPAQRE